MLISSIVDSWNFLYSSYSVCSVHISDRNQSFNIMLTPEDNQANIIFINVTLEHKTSLGHIVAIDNNTLYGSKLYILFIPNTIRY